MKIICAGMSRSGGTLQYQLISSFVENHGGVACGPWNEDKIHPVETMAVYKSERYLNYVDVEYAFAIIRNPLDVCVSLYRYRLAKEYLYPKLSAPFIGEIVHEMISVMEWITNWETAGAKLLRYEDLYPDKFGLIIEQAAKVLKIEYDEKEIAELVNRYSIDENAKRMQAQKQWFAFTDSMLTLAHIGPNRGEPGQGEILPEDVKQMVTEIASPFMERHGYL